MKVTAILRSRIGDHRISFRDLNDKEIVYLWNEKNNWTLEVPTRVAFKNAWGQEVVIYENFAQHLIDEQKDMTRGSKTYGQRAFELVEVKEAPVVTQVISVVDKNKAEPKVDETEEKPKPTKSIKEKTNEKDK